jgi:hypothetical protein
MEYLSIKNHCDEDQQLGEGKKSRTFKKLEKSHYAVSQIVIGTAITKTREKERNAHSFACKGFFVK